MAVQVVPTNSVKDLAITSAKLASSLSVGQLAVTGTTQLSGNVGIGVAPGANAGLICSPTGLTGTTQYQLVAGGNFSSAATTAIGVLTGVNTQAASFTVATGAGVQVNTPVLGSGSAITGQYGVMIQNQGVAGVTNAAGIFVVAQSGASGINTGIALNSFNERIRNPKNSYAAISIESADGYVMLMSYTATYTGANVYWDGTNWVPMNTSANFAISSTGTSGWLWYWAPAASVANVSWNQKMSLDGSSGNLQIAGQNFYFQGGSSYYWNSNGNMMRSVASHIMSDGNFYFNANSGIYLTWTGSYINTSHSITIAGAGNSQAAYISMPARVGQQICIYDFSSGMYGLGINSGELSLITNGTAAVRSNTYNGAYGPIAASAFNVSSSLSVKRDVRNLADPLALVLDDRLHGVAFTRIADDKPGVGFVADRWFEVLPEVVQCEYEMPDGDTLRLRLTDTVQSMDYGAIGAITFEALKLYIQRTDARIADLEARLAA